MISYREKEMMMAMRFLADHTNEFARSVDLAKQDIADGRELARSISVLPELSSYEQIVELARENGYDTTLRIEDLLSEAELEELDREYQAIEDQFNELTGLNKTDAIFIITAVILQMVRQVLQPKVDFEAFAGKDERVGHDKAADDAKKQFDHDKADKLKKEAENDPDRGYRYYYASREEILDLAHVPYDVINGTKQFGVGLGGRNHRLKTLGHDPRLGYLFGTCNILTNTMSLGKENLFRTLHIGIDETGSHAAVANASAMKMIGYSLKRFKESQATVGLAVMKQAYHINSDKYSKEGLPLPFLQILFDADVIELLCNEGLDYAKLEFLETVGKQTLLAELISYVISVAHRVTITVQENMMENKDKVFSKEEFFASLKKQETLNEVRTRKVILISESIATTVNAAVMVGAGIVSAHSGEPETVKAALKYVDLGGYLSTIIHLFSDLRFISKVKKDFIAQAIEKNYMEKLDAIMSQ
ncbi:MAG: hypothetical protein K5921_00555 [Lachnospiraceae bacterium]|nr:hypothetical protein [Lachnospiraceae bacterium]